MNAVIDVQHLKKTFNKETALQDVSFTIQKGEIFGFLGPSGSGKTTTIKILTAQTEKTAGNVLLFGQPAAGMKQSQNRKRFGILTDNSGLYTRLTIEENLLLYSKLYELSVTAVKEALDFVNLYADRKKKISQLSKGMIQRVTLARAIMHKPELLFLDEPTSALDPVNTEHIYNGLRKLNAMGTTIFLTTHDMSEAEILCDRVAFLHKGKIRAIGAPSDLKQEFGTDSMTVELTDGTQEVIQNGAQDAQKLYQWMQANVVTRIHTNEPTLGDIFMQITGSDLV
ncbi:ABC transporter ATP-binding protein [Lysinibacillus fusiformis]|uniref:ABC transporter ATP-binding protein n=1 Tax=Lysinibacillus fusiformis TaxID=28031 RepID=UPI0004D6E763|nr:MULTISPECIES: ABC transporter ATP-binding protein [Lysinibacillus]KEK11807.1 bacitracin ABC transporter ATP-binding protein [Lysinibacillus sphaericus]MDC6269922.1 ABC transporter ATP-binding protein [Lysinibacillus sphaericus]MDN4971131.1 ABC transporter ATP-binding protein [Lysinibacillus fusiformis]QEA00980.1 ABC transporter ATP-binding protein [Lysinibacillus fusiformis]WEA39632.1 ABC transporter ATP-binding protein [Lysinibacillus fusiformis]